MKHHISHITQSIWYTLAYMLVIVLMITNTGWATPTSEEESSAEETELNIEAVSREDSKAVSNKNQHLLFKYYWPSPARIELTDFTNELFSINQLYVKIPILFCQLRIPPDPSSVRA